MPWILSGAVRGRRVLLSFASTVSGDGSPCGIEAYTEEPHLGLWITGNKTLQSWVMKDEKTTFYQLHAYVNNVLRRLGVNMDKLTLEPAIDPTKDCCCGIAQCFSDGLVIKAANGKVLGYMAVVAKDLIKQFDIDNPVYYADLYWKELLKQTVTEVNVAVSNAEFSIFHSFSPPFLNYYSR